MNEVFSRLKTKGITCQNVDGSFPSQGSVFQIANYGGVATFSQDMACDDLDSLDLSTNNATFVNLEGPVITNTLTTNSSISLSDISNLSANYWSNQGSTLYNLGSLFLQQTSTYTDVLGWRNLAPSAFLPYINLSNPNIRISMINTINSLIKIMATKNFLIAINTAPAKPVITGVSVTTDGFTVSWTGVANSFAVFMNGRLSHTVVTHTATFTGLPNTNIFPYLITVAGIDSAGNYSILSDAFPVSVCNINNNISDLGNYYGIRGLSPIPSAYYRATVPDKTNFITLISETTVIPNLNAVTFLISGSNASINTPIKFRFWDGYSYDTVTQYLTDSGPHQLDYNYQTVSWTLS